MEPLGAEEGVVVGVVVVDPEVGTGVVVVVDFVDLDQRIGLRHWRSNHWVRREGQCRRCCPVNDPVVQPYVVVVVPRAECLPAPFSKA